MEVEEIPSHADGLDGGVSAVVGAHGDLGRAAVGVDVQPSALGGLQGLLHQLGLQALAERADVVLRLAVVYRQVAGQLGESGVPLPPELLGGVEGAQGMADGAQPRQAADGPAHQQHVQN